MPNDSEQPRHKQGSIPADVSAAIILLDKSLTSLSEFTDPKVVEWAGHARRAANVVVDGLQNLAADLAESGPIPMCPHGHGPLENGDCPDCGFAL